MSTNSVIERLKSIDVYPKTLDDYRIRTFSGGAVTIISCFIMGLLFLSELNVYLTPDVVDELFVDTSRTPKLKINLNITIHHIPCKYLSLDAMDTSGEQHLQIDHDVYKTPIDEFGKPIDAPTKEDVGASTAQKENVTETEVAVVKCGSCYGAESKELNITCCNTCVDVQEAYLKRRWAFPDPDTIEQCKNDGSVAGLLSKEGCNVHGQMEVNRVGGSFHVAPGQSFSINHVHVHDVQPFSSSSFNSSHTIEHLSFGHNIPGKTNPLDGVSGIAGEGSFTIGKATYSHHSNESLTILSPRTTDLIYPKPGVASFLSEGLPFNATMFQYYLKIVPMTLVYQETGDSIMTNQFSVTRHQKTDTGHGGMPPGIFFSYELAPLMVKYTERRRSFGHFATNVCAIIGGVFTVASIIDSFLYRSLQAFQKKIELGKGY